MSGSAASDTVIYRARRTQNRIRFQALLTTAQNNANVEMGRFLVAKKKSNLASYVITDIYQRFL